LIQKLKTAAAVDKEKLIQTYNVLSKIGADSIKSFVFPAYKIIAIGSSSGGPPALTQLLRSFPIDVPAGIIVGQHMPDTFLRSFTAHLQTGSNFIVKIAEDGDIITYRRILVSPVNKTLTVNKLKRGSVVSLVDSNKKPKPDIDLMLESAALAFQKNAVGVILSGMGDDGTKGLMAIKQSGGKTFAQDEKTSLVWGMPKSAAESGAAERVLPIDKIGPEIIARIKS
jgi:two-component system chemotaxis response regulator CheB